MQNRMHRLAQALQATVAAASEESSTVGGSQPSGPPIAPKASPDTPLPPTSGVGSTEDADADEDEGDGKDYGAAADEEHDCEND